MTMQISSLGIALIISFEGLRLTAYRDEGGILTIGYGHTGLDVREGEEIDRAQALGLLHHDLLPPEDAIGAYVKVPLQQCQFDALCSFIFNIGVGGFEHSSLLTLLNQGKPTYEVAPHFLLYDHIKGKLSEGLLHRRMREMNMFLGK